MDICLGWGKQVVKNKWAYLVTCLAAQGGGAAWGACSQSAACMSWGQAFETYTLGMCTPEPSWPTPSGPALRPSSAWLALQLPSAVTGSSADL